MDRRLCSTCKQDKPLSEFYKSKSGFLGRESSCKGCRRIAFKAFYQANHGPLLLKKQKWGSENREHIREWTREYRKTHPRLKERLKKYGLTPEQFERMWVFQDAKCAICETPDPDKKMLVDHCHKTGKVRGLLCRGCNFGIGFLQDSPAIIQRASGYIKSGGVR